jgi:hypothetical protein
MSFGYSVGDFLALTQLAWKVVQNSRKACGAHDELTGEITRLHMVLRRLELEMSKPDSLLNRSDDNRREELADLSVDCNRVLRVLSCVLEKYNALSDEQRSVTKLWQKIRFGNGEMQDLGEIRLKISTYSSAITLFLNLLSIGSQGKIEQFMDSQGQELREVRQSLNWITASLQAKTREGSILTSYAEDDKAIWKDFRRGLIKEGFSSSLLSQHKTVIREYIMELGSRGALDDIQRDEQDLSVKEDVQPYLAESFISVLSAATISDEAIGAVKPAPQISTGENEDDESLQEDISGAEGDSFQINYGNNRTIKNEGALVRPGLASIRGPQNGKQAARVPQDELKALERRRKQMQSAATAKSDLRRPSLPLRPLNGENQIELEAVYRHSGAVVECAIADVKATQLLLDNGFDIDENSFKIEAALRWAAENGHEPVTRLLLEKGADANAEDVHGLTALQRAAMNGHEAVSRLLLEKGADANAGETYGWTALHTAAMKGHEAVVRLLLEKGKDASAEDIFDRTPLDCAVMNGHKVVAGLLTMATKSR